MSSLIRLKIEIKSDFGFLNKFWYNLDSSKIKTIKQLRRDIISKQFIDTNILKRFIYIKLSVDQFDLPLFETTRLLRDSDIVEVQIISKKDEKILKRKLDEKSNKTKEPLSKKANLVVEEDCDVSLNNSVVEKPVENFEACLIGSSMVKNIVVKHLFPKKRCLFKSISGGKIIDVLNYLKNNQAVLKHSKCFIITCGSNDCDSLDEMNDVINHFTELAQYLKNTYSDSVLIFNKLIPRTKCKYVSLLEFEKRRICFNDFLEIVLPLIVACKIVEHKAFESKTELHNLLTDGVHISPVRGLSIYVDQIKKTLENLN